MNHALSQIDYAHRLTHVEHKYTASGPQCSCLQHQLRRFSNTHKVTRDLGMGHRNWAPDTNLLPEQWHNGSRGSQNIPEAHDTKAGIGLYLRKPLKNQLSKSLRGSHGIGRSHCLISRHQYKRIYAGAMCCPCSAPRPVNVVCNAFCYVVFHHRHMLVCRGVINRVDLKSSENGLKPLLVANASQQGNDREAQPLTLADAFDLSINAVQGKFGNIEQAKFFWRGGQNLAAQL